MNMHNNYTEQWKNQTIERGMYCTVSIIYGVYTFTWGLSKVPYSINKLTGLLKQLMFFKVLNRVTSADFVPLKGFAVQGEYVPAKFSLLVKWKMITMCRMILGDIHSLKSKWTSKQKNTAKQTKKLFFFFFLGKKKRQKKKLLIRIIGCFTGLPQSLISSFPVGGSLLTIKTKIMQQFRKYGHGFTVF